MKFKNSVIVAGILVLCLQIPFAWAGKSNSPAELYYQAKKSYYKLMGSVEKQKFRHQWEKVIQAFSKVQARFPKSRQAYKAVYTIGRLYEGLNGVSKNSKDLDQALRYYKKVSQDFSPGTLTDDALYESAEIYRDKKDFPSAAGIFKTIFEKYPRGDQANKARQQYKKLASIPVHKKKEKVSQLSPTTKKPVVLGKEKKPEAVKHVRVSTPANKKPVTLRKKKKSEPVAVKQAKVTPPAKKKPVKRKILGKGKRGYLYAPASGKARHSSPLIVVDAGHGGKDQGAKSARGAHEKDVNLTISRHVKTILVNRFKYRVVMTRKNDTFIPLKERSEIANNRNADLFVSIHANAAKRKSAHGIETYFLGTSNNDRALATAARENGELVHSVKDDQVQEILASLITTTKINDSSRLAGTVQENLFRSSRKKFRELKNLGVKEGPFYVLHGADMPSILVEVGFLTNPKEARMLSKSDYLYRLASSIAEGIHKYLQEKGPSI
jgi:N-acetylmuramoyl-L-alanine amidase